MKSLNEIRDQLAEAYNLNLFDAHAPSFKAGFDAAVAHLQSAGSAEFDVDALVKAFPEMELADRNTYGKVEAGARWQFNQMQAEIERPTPGQAQMAATNEMFKSVEEFMKDYEKLKAQLAKLAEALKKMCPNHPRDQMTENAIIQVAREALAELSKARGDS